MINIILLANALALASSLINVGKGLICDRRRILLVQCVQKLFGGMSGCISNFIGIARNLWCVKRDMSLTMKTALCLSHVMLTALVSRIGPLESLPIAATCIHTFVIDTKNMLFLKSIMLLSQMMWLVYDFAIGNYVAFTFDAFAACFLRVSIAMLKGLIKPRRHRTRAA